MRRPTVVFAAAGIAALALAGCSSTTTTTATTPAPASPSIDVPTSEPSASITAGLDGYSAEIESGFMSTCPGSAREANPSLSESDATNYCGCVYRAFEAKLPFDQFLALNSGTTSQAAKDLVAECVDDPTAY